MVVRPLHVPSGWQVLMEDPLRMNPGSQVKCILFGNTVKSPEEEPFMGTVKGPQSTAKNVFNQIGSIRIGAERVCTLCKCDISGNWYTL